MAAVFQVETSDAPRKCSHCKSTIRKRTRHLVSSYPYSVYPHYRRNYCKLCVFRAVWGFFALRVTHRARTPYSRCGCGRVKQRWSNLCHYCYEQRSKEARQAREVVS